VKEDGDRLLRVEHCVFDRKADRFDRDEPVAAYSRTAPRPSPDRVAIRAYGIERLVRP